MKSILPILFSLLLILHSCGDANVKQNIDASKSIKQTEIKDATKLLRHVVLFNFNDGTAGDTIRKIENEFIGLAAKISAIHSFEWGTNNSPEGLDKGLTHCFLVTFLTEEDRATYLIHPKHQEFVKLIGPYVEDVTVLDYWKQ